MRSIASILDRLSNQVLPLKNALLTLEKAGFVGYCNDVHNYYISILLE
jgi:hypothetical protein